MCLKSVSASFDKAVSTRLFLTTEKRRRRGIWQTQFRLDSQETVAQMLSCLLPEVVEDMEENSSKGPCLLVSYPKIKNSALHRLVFVHVKKEEYFQKEVDCIVV